MNLKTVSRRRFIIAALLATPFAVWGDARLLEPTGVVVRRHRFGSGPASHRLVHFSDLHHKGDRGYLQAVVGQINALAPDFVCFTGDLVEWVDAHALETGLLTLFCRHTSASLLIQENAAPAVRDDLEAFFEVLAPEDKGRYSHDDEGPDDMPAHIRAALTAPSACRSRSSRAGWRWEPGRASTYSSTAAIRICARSPRICSGPESVLPT